MAEHLQAVGRRRELSQALAERQLAVHFQPIVEIHSGVVRGAEALLRWQHPESGLLPAADFLPAFENSTAMPDVTGFVLEQACRSVAELAPEHWTLSVNVTGADTTRDRLFEQVTAALDASGLAATRLILEVTETGLLSNPTDSTRVLKRLRETGVRISLDDFGTGYSSLRQLRDLPVSELKVDAMFVAAVETSSADAAILTNVIRLAASFEATVVAEGVERVGQASYLEQLGCRYAQGYFWCRPGPLEEVASFVCLPSSRRPQAEPAPLLSNRVRGLLSAGASPHTIAAALNADGLHTRDGKRWHANSVSVLIQRLRTDSPPARHTASSTGHTSG